MSILFWQPFPPKKTSFSSEEITVFDSCEQSEWPIKVHLLGQIEEIQIEINITYRYNQIASKNKRVIHFQNLFNKIYLMDQLYCDCKQACLCTCKM